MEKFVIQSHVLISGEAEGRAVVLPEPLSFWGGLDPQTGDIIDQRHPSLGQNVSGCMLILPVGRGSSSASSILLEAVRVGKAPAAIITAETDAILALGAAVAREMYANSPAVVVLPKPEYNLLKSGMWIHLSEKGVLTLGD
jgi:predicted aconitase with swiveling domain